jgi:hypothetical protein
MEASSTDKRIDELAGQARRFEGKVEHRFERLEDKIDARFAKWDKFVIGGGVSIIGAVVSIAGAAVFKVLGL